MKYGDIIELIEDTDFYKKGQRATFIKNDDEVKSKIHIRYVREEYLGGDVDLMPKSLFKVVNCTDQSHL